MKRHQEIKVIYNQIKKNKKSIWISVCISIIVFFISYIPPLINMKIIDDAIGRGNIELLIVLILIYFFVYVAKYLIQFIEISFKSEFRFSLKNELMNKMLKYYVKNRGLKNDGTTSGEIDSVLRMDVGRFITFVTSDFQDIVVNVGSVIFLSIVMIVIQWDLALVVICTQLISVIWQVRVNKKIENNSEELWWMNVGLVDIMNEILLNIKNLSLVMADNFMIEKYSKQLKKSHEQDLKCQMINIKSNMAKEIFTILFDCILLLLMGYKVINKLLTIGEMMTFLQYISRFTVPLNGLINIPKEYSTSHTSLRKICEILVDIENNERKVSKKQISDVECVNIKNITFSYDGKKNIFKNANAMFRKNYIYYILGKSGAGKSTLIKLLLGERKVDSGNIYFDGTSIKRFDTDEFNKIISWIPQEPIIFSDTIRNNILLGTDIAEDILYDICRKCSIMEDILQFDKGFDTVVSEYGDSLSVGQKHRICLARALIQDKPIIIMDEPTASLDKVTERIIKKTVEVFCKNKIIMIITHSNEFIVNKAYKYEVKYGKLIGKEQYD